MLALFPTPTDLATDHDLIRRRRYGRIECRQGAFASLTFRPWPKRVWLAESRWLGNWQHRLRTGDWCRLYFNQPRGFDNYLSLIFVVSGREASFATFRAAVQTLDEIARIKDVDALLCDASNERISPRLLQRWGWQSHAPSLPGRNYIKRLRQPFSWQAS